MLFDYLFLTALGLDWLILGLVVFGSKPLYSSLPENGKNRFGKSIFFSLLFLLLLLSFLKILFLFLIGFQLKHSLVSVAVSISILLFVFFQLVFAFIFLVLSMMFYAKDGFIDDFRNAWIKRISIFLTGALFADFFLGLIFYVNMLMRLMPGNLRYHDLTLLYHPLAPKHYWLALGLVLALVTYFIFFRAVKHRHSSTTVWGMGISYLVVLGMSGLLIQAYLNKIIPDARFVINDFTLYATLLLGTAVLFSGISGIFLIVLFFRRRSYLKNDFYFRYILIRLAGFHAVSVFGFSLITLVPAIFFTWYQ